jgi:hypothetical protein
MNTLRKAKIVAIELMVAWIAALPAWRPSLVQGQSTVTVLSAGPRAGITLSDAQAVSVLTSDTAWSLAKTGSVNTSNHTVTWNITATKGQTTAGQLIVDGYMAVTNTGSAGATIGNIVVNLQTRSGNNWVTASSDVADATQDDAATSALIDSHASSENRSSFSENGASGQLKFMDANTNTIFALVPEVTIAPGATVNLLFAASFNNNVLNLPVGKSIRAEVIVSFGNAGPNGQNTPNVDINGNGVIDADEAYVRSVPARITMNVPTAQSTNSSPTISDTANDIATTGTVTFSNASFNIGATSGTVTVTYDGGTDGGSITNCANLTGNGSTTNVNGFQFPNVTGVNLQACNTQSIGASTCTPGAAGCGWHDGDLTTYSQNAWGTGGVASPILINNYGTVYAGTGGIFQIGYVGGFTAVWTNATALATYLPASGTVGTLDANLLDPTSTSSGVFGGEVAALKVNIDFSDAGVLSGAASLQFGNLTLCGFTTMPALNGLTVRGFLDVANSAIGGGGSLYSPTQLDLVANALNGAFFAGAPSSFAQTQLVNGACP